MSEGDGRKRKSKGWYRKQAYHNKRVKTEGKPGHRLTVGLRGYIVTCNDREREAVKETYNILNEYADKLYGPEMKEEAGSSEESEGDDIEAAIAKQVQTLKDSANKDERRFQNCLTGAKNCIFIKTSLDDPAGLAHAIFTDLRATRVQKCRHALRLLPVVGTCKAGVKDISDLAKDVLRRFFTDTQGEVTFTINFKSRNNTGIGRDMVISTLRSTIQDTFSSAPVRFTYTDPAITIQVEVMCGVACIAVAKDFALFRKYNLIEVLHDRPAHSTQGHGAVQSQHVPGAEQTADIKGASVPGIEQAADNQGASVPGVEQAADSKGASVPGIEQAADSKGASVPGVEQAADSQGASVPGIEQAADRDALGVEQAADSQGISVPGAEPTADSQVITVPCEQQAGNEGASNGQTDSGCQDNDCAKDSESAGDPAIAITPIVEETRAASSAVEVEGCDKTAVGLEDLESAGVESAETGETRGDAAAREQEGEDAASTR